MDYEPKRLQCKCICTKYKSKPIREYEQNDPCCQCDNNRGNRDYSNAVYTPSQHIDIINNEIYTPAPYPTMIYPTVDLNEMGKIFPWLTWGLTKTTKSGSSGDKDNENDDRGKTGTTDNRHRTNTKDDKDTTSTVDDKYKTTITDDTDKTSTTKERYKINSKYDREQTSTKDGRDRTSTNDDKDKTNTKDDKDKTSTNEKPIEKSTPKAVQITTAESKHSTAESTLSTSPYMVKEYLEKLLHYVPKKKTCLRDNCLRKDTKKKVGRYNEDDLVERPTIASYLNGNRGRKYSNVQEKRSDERLHFGIVPIPDELAMKFM
ncbi:jg23162, partial [Pararge aegeria aegeria]